MTAERSPSSGRIRSLPADLLGVVAVVILANVAVFHPVVSESPFRVITGLLFALFVPGYALVAALFPEAGRPPENTRSETTPRSDGSARPSKRRFHDHFRGVDRWERLALSFALSLAIVPLLAMGVTLSSLLFTTFSLFMTISAFTVLCTVIAMKRRWALSPQKRFRLSVVDRFGSFTDADSRGGVLLNVALVVAILFAVGTLGFTVIASPDGEQFTEFYVLSEDEDGELVAAEYPDSLTPGEPQQVYAGIDNHEGETVEYDVVVQLQRVEESDQGAVVTERHRVDQFSAVLEHNESRVDERNLTVSDELTGSDLRLEFLLYKDSVPETPTGETAYRKLHIWIDVQNPGQPSTTGGATLS